MNLDWGVLLRLYTMIAAVSSVSLFVFSSLFTSTSLAVAIVAVATIALVSAILGFILATVEYADASIETPGEESLPGSFD